MKGVSLLLGGVCSRWGSAPRGVSALGVSALGVSVPGGCLFPGGVCSWRGVCSQGMSALGGIVSAPGGYIPACTEADTPPPFGQTHACENITLAQLCCGR